jgi:hypothetical protein
MKAFITLSLLVAALNVFGQVDTVSNLPDADKAWGLTKFYTEAKYNFVYFDKARLDWDSAYRAFLPQVLATKSTYAYYRTLLRFCALLKDGHTNVNEPDDLMKNVPNGSRYKRLQIEHFNGRFFVVNAPKAADPAVLGAEVVRIDGRPAADWARDNLFPYLCASTEHQRWNDAARSMFYGTDSTRTWQLTLQTAQGKQLTYRTGWHTYPAEWQRPRPTYKRFAFRKIGEVGYLEVNTFGEAGVIEDFKKVLPELYACKGIILDIRRNGGGNSDIAAELLKYFTTEKYLVGSAWKTRSHQGAFKAWGSFYLAEHPNVRADTLPEFTRKIVQMARDDHWYAGDTMRFENNLTVPRLAQPLVVLQSNGTASAAEDFLIMLSSLKGRARTMGQQSFGSTGQPLHFDLPGGGSARVCAKRDTYPDGREFVGVGVPPDVELVRNVQDVLKGTDAELEAALKELKQAAGKGRK